MALCISTRQPHQEGRNSSSKVRWSNSRRLDTSTDTHVELGLAGDSLLLGGSSLSADGLLSAIRRVRTQVALPLCPIFTPHQITRFSPFSSSSIPPYSILSFCPCVFVRMSEIILQDCCMLLRHWKRETLSLT